VNGDILGMSRLEQDGRSTFSARS